MHRTCGWPFSHRLHDRAWSAIRPWQVVFAGVTAAGETGAMVTIRLA